MISLTPPVSRISRVVFVFGIVCLATVVAGVIFVAARSNDGELPATNVAKSPVDVSTKAKIAERFGELPLSFEINKGQTDQAVEFLSHGPGYDLFLTANEAVLSLRKPEAPNAKVREGSVLRLKMIGANVAPRVEGQDELPGKVNYFIGNDPEKWRRNISTYGKVQYRDVYPGIDVVYYGNQRELEYDFVVAAGANPKLIKFSVEGAERIRLDQEGNLLLALKHGEVRLNKPLIYQLTDEGNRREVKGSYVIKGNEVRFNVRGTDSRKTLVIDPILSYATFLGGSGHDDAMGIAVDAQGSAYVTGTTNSFPFPTTPGAFTDNPFGGAFVTKLDPTGRTLVYSTFLSSTGGIGGANGTDIAVDSSGNAYITGFTSTDNFPVVNGLKSIGNFFKSTDSASNWNNNNTGLVGDIKTIAVAPSVPNTIYAGTPNGPFRSTDAGATWSKTPTTGLPSFVSSIALAVDPTNASVVYVGLEIDGLFKSTDGGNNWSAVNVPLNNAAVFTIVFDPSIASTMYVGSSKGIFKSTDSGSTWTSLNNFGATGIPFVRALAIDPTTPATIYAGTSSSGVFKTTNGGSNWTAMNDGILGGNFSSAVNAIVIDPSNPSTIYAAHDFSGGPGGFSKSTNGAGSWTPINNGVPPNDAIKAMVGDRTNTATLYAATLFSGIIKTTNGGATWTNANTGFWRATVRALVAHPSDSTILYAGASSDLSSDAFVSKLNATGSDLLFSTILGGSSSELGLGIAVDGSGNISVVGSTHSINFPTVNAFQSAPGANVNCGGSISAFVTKINPSVPSYVFSTYLGGSRCDTAHSVATDSEANVYVTGDTLSADFPLANAFQATIGDTLSREDAFVTKFNSSGSLSYSTYLGGNNSDTGFGIAVDSSGNAYVTGSTTSTNFPTVNPIQATPNGRNKVFVTKLNSQGSALVYSTYLGGSNFDVGRGIAVDATGNAYITGFTGSVDFPLVAGAIRTNSAMYKSVDAATNWSNDNYGLKISAATINHLAVHPTQTAIVYAGTTLGVFRSTDAGKNWSPINNGLTGHFVVGLVIDPLTPSTLYVAASNDFGSTGGVYKSTDGGNSWNLRKSGMTNTNLLSLAIDPVTPSTLYAGASGGPIFKTTDGADNWAPSGNVPPIFPVALAVDPHTPSRIFATESSSAGGVFRSIDSGASWQSVSLNQTGAHGGFVGVSPHTPGLVYATTSGSGLFKSVDGGDNWSSIRPQSRSGKIVFDPVSSSTLYLISAFEGLLKSTDNGQTWKDLNNGLPAPSVTAFAINPLRPSTLYLASGSALNQDSFVTKINPAGSALVYSTFVGGTRAPLGSSELDVGAVAIALDSAGNAYIAGEARFPNLPSSQNVFQPFNGGFDDAFIAKVSMSHILSGQVLEDGGAPVNGAEVVLNDGASITAIITDSDGSYEFSHLREGGDFTVSASKPHFTMAPPSQSFSNLTGNQTLDFTATATNAPFFTISGQVTENSVGLAGVTVTLSGSQSGLRTTDGNGNYSFEVAGGGNYTITPSALGFAFGPPNHAFNNLSAAQAANFTANRQSFVVTNDNDHGTGSLREAITNANATAGADTITFNIPGPGVKVINVVAPLPEITESVVINASTQPGYAGSPLIELDGDNAGFVSGLVITAGNTTVRGLAIGSFDRSGIELRSCDNNVIQGNYIGVDATGTLPRPNNTGILLFDSSNNVIGGTSAAARNVVSGNVTHGVEVGGSGNVVQGNFIGTNAAGTAELANGTNGVEIPFSTRTNNLIGGNSPGAGNLISGNQRGIHIESPGNTIQGNLIGTDVTGTKRVHNVFGIEANIPNTLIGGLTATARNVISGNSTGVSFGGSGSKLQGNFIGTDITGTLALGNGTGVTAGTNALIGGTDPEARNVISGSDGLGNVALGFSPSGPGVIVQGNYIGTDVTGTRALSELTAAGIFIFSANNLIGGLVPGAQNVISGNRSGIIFNSFTGFPRDNVIQGNLIGLNALGTGPLPNTEFGIVFFGSFNNTIGGTQSAAANKIAFNGKAGVRASGGRRNSIRGNSIFSNGGLGIDLGTEGVTANDSSDPDEGENNLQNFPVLTSVMLIGNSTTIQGSLNSTPNTTFQIDFYSSVALDLSGNGEGALFFNTTSVTTDANGDATINATFPVPLGAGRVVTATATDPDGNTSEFSSGDITSATGNLQFSVSSIQVIEDIGLVSLTVLRKGGSTGSLSIDYATVDGTATAGQDYTATSGTLTFNAGETSKTIQIAITDDAVTETDETFTVALRNSSSLETLGTPNTVVVTIQDRSTPPVISGSVASVFEGDTGSTTETLVTFTLSAATGRAVSVSYATSNIGAFGGTSCSNPGTDYQTVSGTISFQPGSTSVDIPVTICGDTSAEANETFRINLSNPSNAVLDSAQSSVKIIDDDPLELLLEESGPTVNHAAALDAFLFLRDPFRIEGIPQFFPTSDRNTRVMFFVRGLQLDPGESPSAVIVRLWASDDQFFDVPAEDVRPVPNVDFTQLVIRLPDGLPVDTYAVTIRVHSRNSSTGLIRIAP